MANTNQMNVIIFGPPGIGKGTISALLTKRLRIPHVPTGDILREDAKKKESKLREYMEKGLLAPDDIVSKIIGKRLKKADCKNGFILDGFPRTLAQAKFLENISITIDKAINMEADEDVIIGRLSGRMICPKCGAIYHQKNIPPKVEGICDKCGYKLIQRADDTPEVIKKRIAVYKNQTKPLLKHYGKRGIVSNIDANKASDDILNNTLTALKHKI